MRISGSLIVVLAFCASTAQAATFYARSGASAGPYAIDPSTGLTLSDSDNDLINSTIAPNIGAVSGAVSSSASGSGSLGAATGDGSAAANTLTGELKASASTMSSGAANGGAAGDAQIRESFTLNGSGTFTASMAVDVDWSIFGNGWQFQAHVNTSFGRDFLFFNQSTGPSSNSYTNKILSVSGVYNNANNLTVNITWYLLAQILQGTTGSIDATNTATIFFETSDGLTATPSASSFLSNAVYPDDVSGNTGPAAVPLPASGLMLISALAGLLGWRHRRHNAM